MHTLIRTTLVASMVAALGVIPALADQTDILFPNLKTLAANCVRGRISDNCAQFARVQAAEAATIRGGNEADYAAFNSALAARTAPCQGMIGMLIDLDAASGVDLADNTPDIIGTHGEPAGLIGWSQAANAAKVCAARVHAETSDPALVRVPQTVLKTACMFVKNGLAYAKKRKGVGLQMYAAQTSWACGWPSPIPGYRPVPGMMPPE
jgi:hypothetical protein